MNFKGIEICCPACYGDLSPAGPESLGCTHCDKAFPVVLGIPDLRLEPDPYIGFEEERAKVQKLSARFHELNFSDFVDFYYSITSVVPPKHAEQYKRGLAAGVSRARGWLVQWEKMAGISGARGKLLEIGCGTAPVLAAAAEYPVRAGVDIALRWLVVARKRLEQANLDLPLICASAAALPFAGPQFDHVVVDSTIEHVRDQALTLRQAQRVLRGNGTIFISTPNRRSIGPDPQTGLPCGSFLPASWTAAWVRRSGGIPPKRKLLIAKELRNLLSRAGFGEISFSLPAISAEQRSHFHGLLGMAAKGYEIARALPGTRHLLSAIGPLLLATARKAP